MDIRRIEDALKRHSCLEALAWCSENKTALRKLKVSAPTNSPVFFSEFRIISGLSIAQSTLEFDLRLQEYIELARARRTQEAIAYSKKHLASWQETHIAQIQQASALLAFPPTTNCGPYKVPISC